MRLANHLIPLTLATVLAGCAAPKAIDEKALAPDEGLVILSVSSNQPGRLNYEDASLSALESAAMFVGEKMRVDVRRSEAPQLAVFTAKAGQYRIFRFGLGDAYVNYRGSTVTVKAGVANYIGRVRIERVTLRSYAFSESYEVAEDRPKFEARFRATQADSRSRTDSRALRPRLQNSHLGAASVAPSQRRSGPSAAREERRRYAGSISRPLGPAPPLRNVNAPLPAPSPSMRPTPWRA